MQIKNEETPFNKCHVSEAPLHSSVRNHQMTFSEHSIFLGGSGMPLDPLQTSVLGCCAPLPKKLILKPCKGDIPPTVRPSLCVTALGI